MLRSVAVVLSGNVMSAALNFAYMYGLAVFLSEEDFGKISLILTVVAIVEIVMNFGSSSAMIGYVNGDEMASRNGLKARVFCFSFRWSLLMSVFSFIILTAIGSNFGIAFYEIIVVVVVSFCLSMYSNVIASYQSDQNWKVQNIFLIVNNATKLLVVCFLFALVIIGFFDISDYDLVLVSLMIYSFGLVFLAIFISIKKGFFRIGQKIQKDMMVFRYAYPLGLANITIILSMRLDGMLIVLLLGPVAFAAYSAANILGLAIPLLTRSLMNVAFSVASKKSTEYIHQVWQQQIKIAPYLLGVASCICLISPYLMGWLYGEKYSDGSVVFLILSLGYLGGVFFVPLESYFYAHRPKRILFYKLGSLLSLIVTGYPFIYFYGIEGAATCVLFSKVVSWCLVLRDTRTGLKEIPIVAI